MNHRIDVSKSSGPPGSTLLPPKNEHQRKSSLTSLFMSTHNDWNGYSEDEFSTMQTVLIDALSETLSSHARAAHDEEDTTTALYLDYLREEIHLQMYRPDSTLREIDNQRISRRGANTMSKAIILGEPDDFKGLPSRSNTPIDKLVKVLLLTTIEPLLLHPVVSFAATDGAVKAATDGVEAASSSSTSELGTVLYNIYMSVSFMMASLFSLFASILDQFPINLATVIALVTIGVSVLVFRQIEMQERSNFEDVSALGVCFHLLWYYCSTNSHIIHRVFLTADNGRL